MSRLTRDGTTEPVSRDQFLRRERRPGDVHFSCLAGHKQSWQPYPVDPHSAICDDHACIHTYKDGGWGYDVPMAPSISILHFFTIDYRTWCSYLCISSALTEVSRNQHSVVMNLPGQYSTISAHHYKINMSHDDAFLCLALPCLPQPQINYPEKKVKTVQKNRLNY